MKSEPIPEANDEPVKVVVGNSLEDIVFKSGKNGMYFFFYLVLFHGYQMDFGIHCALNKKYHIIGCKLYEGTNVFLMKSYVISF